jgi:hypothetical protein
MQGMVMDTARGATVSQGWAKAAGTPRLRRGSKMAAVKWLDSFQLYGIIFSVFG